MIKAGDKVECIHDADWQNEHRERDSAKAKQLGRPHFMGRAAAYMHLDEAYVVEQVTRGGLRLRGFAPLVSRRDVRPSTKPTYR